MFSSVRPFRPSLIATLCASAITAALVSSASAQTSTAPQLLPYTSSVLAGGGATATTAGSTCQRAVFPATSPVTYTKSGYTSVDAYGDGCLATEVTLTNAKHAIADPHTGAIYYTDYASATTGMIHRIDPVTGIVTAIGGGATSSPSKAACTAGNAADTRTSTDVLGDGCLATSVELSEPVYLQQASNGDLYFADINYHDVRKISMSNGGVASVAITFGGSGYATAPTVTFSAPGGSGTTATGTAIINGSGTVTGVTITNAGSGYTSAPTVTFSVPGTGIAANTATGFATYTGVISLVVGNNNGTSATADGYSEGCTPANSASPCLLRVPYGLAFTAAGTLLITENYYYAVFALNPNAATETVLGTPVPQGVLTRIVGATANGTSTTCVNGTATSSGCTKGKYVAGNQAAASELGSSYITALDSYGNGYITNSGYDTVAQISGGVTVPGQSSAPAAGVIGTYAGILGSFPSTDYTTATFPRGIASTIEVDGTEGVALDSSDNLYLSGFYNHNVWRVDGATQTMFNLVGTYASTPPYTTSGNCATSGVAASMTPTDTYGDGCPGTLLDLGQMSFVSVDANSNIYLGDGGNKLYHEVATGAQFGNTGATQTDYLEVHFQAGDTPAGTNPYTVATLTGGTNVFTLGSATCTTNTDNNSGAGNSTDCVVPITASPMASGPYSGTLTVVSTKGATVTFPLSGTFVQSPVTRTAVSYTVSVGGSCGSSTYGAATSFTFTATLTANGPTAPTGNIQFYDNGVAIGKPQTVSPLGTSSAPVYGAVLTTTLSGLGAHPITAIYTPTGGYYIGSTSSPTSVTLAPSGFSTTPVISGSGSTPTYTVSAGGTALYSFNLATTVYNGTINFSCTGLPAGTSCAFSPAGITATGCSTPTATPYTVALSIYTTARTVSTPAGFGGSRGPWSMIGLFAGLMLATCVGIFRRRLPMRAGQLLMALALVLGASGMVACSKPAGTVLAPGTPSGNYTVAVNANGSDGTTSSFNVSLIVK